MSHFPSLHPAFLALELNGATMLVFAVVGIALLGVIYFGIRFWLVSTRPADIREVNTPTLDRLNEAALEQMAAKPPADDEAAEEDDEDAPTGLKSAVPDKEP